MDFSQTRFQSHMPVNNVASDWPEGSEDFKGGLQDFKLVANPPRLIGLAHFYRDPRCFVQHTVYISVHMNWHSRAGTGSITVLI